MSSLTLRPSELGECPSITGAIIMLAVLCGLTHYYISLKAVQSCVGCYCTSIDTCFVPQEFKAYILMVLIHMKLVTFQRRYVRARRKKKRYTETYRESMKSSYPS